MKPKLSILICSTETRVTNFLGELFKMLCPQIPTDKSVEVICLVDNKIISVGEKRNELIRMSNGEYVVFIDDDDIISDDYVSSLLDAIQSGSDAICFDVMRYENDIQDKIVHYSKDYKNDSNDKNCYIRIPNHLMCIKRDIAIQVLYKNISFGEDSDFAKRLKPLLHSETQINKILYSYMFNSKTTETQLA